jgi:hypothetical protein
MGNERARQKKLERKRLKREEKRRSARAAGDPVLLSLPSDLPAMSLTLQRFAGPLLDRLPDQVEAQHWKFVLGFAAMVWNAAAEGEEFCDDELEVARRAYEGLGWDQDRIEEDARLLRKRKATAPFSREPRKIVELEVAATETGVRVYAASAMV